MHVVEIQKNSHDQILFTKCLGRYDKKQGLEVIYVGGSLIITETEHDANNYGNYPHSSQ